MKQCSRPRTATASPAPTLDPVPSSPKKASVSTESTGTLEHERAQQGKERWGAPLEPIRGDVEELLEPIKGDVEANLKEVLGDSRCTRTVHLRHRLAGLQRDGEGDAPDMPTSAQLSIVFVT